MIGKLAKCCFYFTEDGGGYDREQEEEGDDFSRGDLDFDVRHFIDSDDANKGEGSDDNSCRNQATSASREIEEEEMDPDELEEKLKKLEEVFCCLPKVLIKRILCGDDAKGDLEIASQRLQEFQDMENPQDLFKAPTTPKRPAAEKSPGSGGNFQAPGGKFNAEKRPEEGKWSGMGKAEQQVQGKKNRRRRKKKNNRNANQMLGEQNEVKEQPEWKRNSFNKNEEQMDGNQFYRHQDSRGRGGFRGRPRGRPGPRGGYRGGFAQSQRDKPEYRDDGFQDNWRFGCQGDNYTRQPQGGRGNWNGRENPPKIKPKPWRGPSGVARGGPSRVPRGGFVHEEYRDDAYQDWDDSDQYDRGGEDNWQGDDEFGIRRQRYEDDKRLQFAEGRGGRGQPSHGYRGGDDFNRRNQANRERPGSGAYREQGRGGMRRAQSLSSVEVDRLAERRENEGDESRFEQNKLVVRGLSASTTDDGVLNFIEAMSGEEVKEVTMLGKGKALVTMAEQITSKYLRSPKGFNKLEVNRRLFDHEV